jgi:hypothetical protein
VAVCTTTTAVVAMCRSDRVAAGAVLVVVVARVAEAVAVASAAVTVAVAARRAAASVSVARTVAASVQPSKGHCHRRSRVARRVRRLAIVRLARARRSATVRWGRVRRLAIVVRAALVARVGRARRLATVARVPVAPVARRWVVLDSVLAARRRWAWMHGSSRTPSGADASRGSATS